MFHVTHEMTGIAQAQFVSHGDTTELMEELIIELKEIES